MQAENTIPTRRAERDKLLRRHRGLLADAQRAAGINPDTGKPYALSTVAQVFHGRSTSAYLRSVIVRTIARRERRAA